MKTSFRTWFLLALIVAAIGLATAQNSSAATNIHSPIMNAEGIPVFYVVMLGDGTIRPASPAEKTALDVAMANGLIEQIDRSRYLGTQ